MLELNNDNFEEEVLNASETVLVDFWSPTCEPCKALLPKVHELEETYGEAIKFTSLDITTARRLSIKQKVMGLPVVAIYKDGVKVDSVVGGDASVESVEEMIKKYQ